MITANIIPTAPVGDTILRVKIALGAVGIDDGDLSSTSPLVSSLTVDGNTISASNPLPTQLSIAGVAISNLNALPTAPAAPVLGSIFAGASNGTTTQTATDITGATGITANKVFTGNVAISVAASQTAIANAAGTVLVTVTWVPGTAGTPAQRVATINLTFGLGGVTNLTAPTANDAIMVPVQLYVGTTSGKFQATVTTTGTVTTIAWDVSVTGNAN